MSKAKQGDKVKVHYTGKMEDGTEFDSSTGRDPLEFTIGEGDVIPGFEKAVLDMEVGEKKTVDFPPEEGYGECIEEMVFEVDKAEFPDDIGLEDGLELSMQNEEGQIIPVIVKEVKESSVFDVELVEIV